MPKQSKPKPSRYVQSATDLAHAFCVRFEICSHGQPGGSIGHSGACLELANLLMLLTAGARKAEMNASARELR